MMLILAPVSFSKSGARRCKGSWIAPVCVMRLTVTPSNGPAAWLGSVATANIAPASTFVQPKVLDIVGSSHCYCSASEPLLVFELAALRAHRCGLQMSRLDLRQSIDYRRCKARQEGAP